MAGEGSETDRIGITPALQEAVPVDAMDLLEQSSERLRAASEVGEGVKRVEKTVQYLLDSAPPEEGDTIH